MSQQPSKPIIHRARQSEQKLERRQAILDSAAGMFASASYESVTMAEIASKLGLVKGTLYLYFKTKEELFLALIEQGFVNWFNAIDASLGELPEGQSAGDIARLLATSLRGRTEFVRLVAILGTALEQNIEANSALRFRTLLLQRMTQTGGLIEAYLPFLRAGEGQKMLMRIHALIVGLHHLAKPAPVVEQVLQEPALRPLLVDFEQELAMSIELLLLGIEKNG